MNHTPSDLADTIYNKLRHVKGLPDVSILKQLFEIIFYASLKTEEGQFIKVTITFIDPKNKTKAIDETDFSDQWRPIPFANKMAFNVDNLVKLSKAADPWSSSLAVYFLNNELYIWGMIDQSIHYQSYLNYELDNKPIPAGLFQTIITGIGSISVIFDYELVAVLKQNNLISNYVNVFGFGLVKETIKNNSENIKNEILNYFKQEYGDDPSDSYSDWINYSQTVINQSLLRILLRIQNYQHGGAMLITKDKKELSIKYKIKYERLRNSIIEFVISKTQYESVTDSIEAYIKKYKDVHPQLCIDKDESYSSVNRTSNQLKGAIRYIASLSCVDGLILLNPELEVLGFGTVIRTKRFPDTVFKSTAARVDIQNLTEIQSDHFGTRHRSMFAYCWKYPGSLGFVISQDGEIRAITRLEDKLIIWENIKVQHYLKSLKLKPIKMVRTK